MRKIDYRFWDKKLKQMHTMTAYEGGRRINTHEEGHMRTTIIKPSVINENNEIFFIEDIILMQYIGRDDDSTGKKIYEGDLVVAIEDVVYIGFVEFKNNSFCITDNSSFTLYNLSDYELHVIGNIYDNENIYNAITDNNVIHDDSASECEREEELSEKTSTKVAPIGGRWMSSKYETQAQCPICGALVVNSYNRTDNICPQCGIELDWK